MCLRHYCIMRPGVYQAQPVKQTSRLSSLWWNLTAHGRACIHQVPQPTGLCSSVPQPRRASWPTRPAVGPAGTWATGCLHQCYEKWAPRPRSILCFSTLLSPSARDTHLCYSKLLEIKKPWTQKDSSVRLGRENKSCKEPECRCFNISSNTGFDDPHESLPSQDILCSVTFLKLAQSGFSLRKVPKAIVKGIPNPILPHTPI